MFVNNDPISYSKIPAGYQPKPTAETEAAQGRAGAANGRDKESPAYILSLSGKMPEGAENGREEKANKQPAVGNNPAGAAEAKEKKAAGAENPADKGETGGEGKKGAAEGPSANAGEPWRRGKSPEEQRQIEREVQAMRQTENKVIAHEQAHKSAGGQYAGGISYEKSAGPDGKQYIVGGEVSIDMSGESTPQKTIAKMRIVRGAALAPADPSGQDRAVAAAAAAKEAAARQALSKNLREETAAKLGKAAPGAAANAPVGKNAAAQNEKAADKENYGVFKDASAREQEPDIGTWVDLSA
ncbi:MAG: hypothetical protein LBO03_07910 [Acidaminococcales bacterium]|jgi:hypothetical protein|nr:hypothetical protein [Acidaminococcales bacterium]